jgi:thioredoxin-dependent peroxiredoxin
LNRRDCLGLWAALVGGGTALPAHAALKAGSRAPDFTATGSLAGQPISFSLAQSLQSGPVVLYFYPAAFTSGCTVEAHQFAEATDTFKSLGATVVGVSVDDLATLHRFSVSECRNKFAVLSDADRRITRAYDAALAFKPDIADRVSYVIVPGGTVAYEYTSLNPNKHVANTLEAVRRWKASQAGSAAASASR